MLWTDEDRRRAGREGWDLFDAYGSEHGEVQLQKFDVPEEHEDAPVPYPFTTDADAWLFVRSKAGEGSKLHRKALEILARDNPEEYGRIMQV